VDDDSRQAYRPKTLEDLHARSPELQLIVLTDDPSLESETTQAVGSTVRYLTKPIDLADLRAAVESALRNEKGRIQNAEIESKGNGLNQSDLGLQHSAIRNTLMAFAKELVMPVVPVRSVKVAGIAVFILVVLIGIGMMLGGVPAPWQAAGAEKPSNPPGKKTAPLSVERVNGKAFTLFVPDDARKALGISTPKGDFVAIAKKPTPKTLVMPGSTMLDPTHLYRIRARFAPSPSSAECIEIGPKRDESSPVTKEREIRSGDHVQKGDLLAVFQSVDVGNKKNDLIDAIYQLHLDQQILKKAEEHADSVPEVFLWNAQRQVAGDQNVVNRAIATLRSWVISEKDIEKVQDEAKEVIRRGGKHDPGVDTKWPRVEIKAPDDGVIVERNLALHEIVVDNTTNIFQIAKLDRLAVLAYCPEDDLPELERLSTEKRRWTVKTVGSRPVSGPIDDISYIIDPNQHTAVIKGHIDNPKEVLRAGQFIEATIELRPPDNVVEIPVDAVSEDGQQAVVFVVSDSTKHHYTMRRVQVEARFDNTVFVRSKPFDSSVQPSKEELAQGILPKEPLTEGEKVLQTGVGELKAKLLDLESQPEKK
jgi:cobalt-zinc-cadmium efflux system membrane fusion protein